MGKNLNAKNLIKAMETLKDFKGISSPITYSPAEGQGTEHVFYSKIQPNGSIERLMDWIKITILQFVFSGKILKAVFLGIEVKDYVIGKGTHNILLNASISPFF